MSLQSLEDEFILLDTEAVQTQPIVPPTVPSANGIAQEQTDIKENPTFFSAWIDQSSAKHSTPELFGANTLRALYPTHSLVMSEDLRLNPLALPDTQATPFSASEVVKNAVFRSIPRRIGGKVPGTLVDSVVFGAFNVTWSGYDFILFITTFPQGFGVKPQYFILHDGPEQPARDLLLSAGLFQDALHDEVWVFNQGFWNKDHGLWAEIQKASWDDVILKAEFKEALQKDIYGFFKSEPVYKELSIPWKRGLIMYGPPGNGKTISIKTVMKTCAEQGFNPLYVKSFQSFRGEEGAMQDVFAKARQVSPCVIVLEDLDSLINDRNRSFFLNQLDGLEGNDGLLVIGSTNHYDKLDPALSERPSRFDRKYNFDDPDYDGRELYAKYWQGKLKSNKAISFPDSLPGEVAALTAGFSFAYLKEAFVSTLVLIASQEDDHKAEFGTLLKNQIETLRKEIGKQKSQGMRKDQSNVTEPVVNGEDSRGIPVQLGARLSEPSPIVARPSGSIANFQASAISPSFLENLRSHQLVAPLDGPLVLPATLSCGASITSIRHPPSSNVAETQTTALHTVHPKVVMPGSLSHYNSIVRERRKTGSPHSGASSASSSKDSAIHKETEKPSLSFGAASTTKPNASAPPTGLPTRPDITRRSPAGGRPASLLTRGHLSAAPSYAYPPAPMMPGSLQDGEDASQSWNKKSPSTQGIGSELFHF